MTALQHIETLIKEKVDFEPLTKYFNDSLLLIEKNKEITNLQEICENLKVMTRNEYCYEKSRIKKSLEICAKKIFGQFGLGLGLTKCTISGDDVCLGVVKLKYLSL